MGLIDEPYAEDIKFSHINLEYLICEVFSVLHSCIYDHLITVYFIGNNVRSFRIILNVVMFDNPG